MTFIEQIKLNKKYLSRKSKKQKIIFFLAKVSCPLTTLKK